MWAIRLRWQEGSYMSELSAGRVGLTINPSAVPIEGRLLADLHDAIVRQQWTTIRQFFVERPLAIAQAFPAWLAYGRSLGNSSGIDPFWNSMYFIAKTADDVYGGLVERGLFSRLVAQSETNPFAVWERNLD